ncbi:MAG: Surfeit locus 1 family protein [Gammaproteobacteria bacterium]|nr:MAG: Surfeit locus 1 family protein [Gammaproteobacteria bacterium]
MRPGALLALAAALLVIAALVWLGNWQLRRLEWKLDLIEAIETRATAEPIPATPTLPEPVSDHVYRRVTARGHYLHDKTRQVKAVTEIGAGYWVMTPLATPDFALWVNRGFVPAEHRARGAYEEPDGEMIVEGLVRASEPNGTLLQKNRPDQDRWFSRDVAVLTATTGTSDAANYFIDAITEQPASMEQPASRDHTGSSASTSWPRAGLTRLSFRNTHLAYAITWYAMAAALSAALAWVVFRNPA